MTVGDGKVTVMILQPTEKDKDSDGSDGFGRESRTPRKRFSLSCTGRVPLFIFLSLESKTVTYVINMRSYVSKTVTFLSLFRHSTVTPSSPLFFEVSDEERKLS